MKKNAVVLGCGLVGAAMARDIAEDPEFDVAVADVNEENLERVKSIPRLRRERADLSDRHELAKLIGDADVVLGALPSRFGFATLRNVIEAGKPYADISFMAEDSLALDELAKKKRVSAVVDCGVSPGLSNFMIGGAFAELDAADRAEILVGGLPKVREWPFQYKAPFAPSDVIEEYTRPARLMENGKVVVRPALSEPELVTFPRAGTLEAFNTDGLRTLLKTIPIPNMREKTLRYPGHCELMRAFRETGLFSQMAIEVAGAKVRPLDVTAKLLFPKWTYGSGEEEFTVLRVIVEGMREKRRVRHTFDLYDEYDRTSGLSSMARTTAFPCAIMARVLARREFTEFGVFPPELLARDHNLFDHVVDALRHRGVVITKNVETVSPVE